LFFCLTLLQLLHLLDLAAVGLHLSLFDSTRKNEDTGRENKGKQKERARKREKLEKVQREGSEQKEKNPRRFAEERKTCFPLF
jgi:hemolysin activation/secretion protein